MGNPTDLVALVNQATAAMLRVSEDAFNEGYECGQMGSASSVLTVQAEQEFDRIMAKILEEHA